MRPFILLLNLLLIVVVPKIACLPYDEEQVEFNLNQNRTAKNPLDYWGEWNEHEYFPSPRNWRMPMYTIFLDRFVNGIPENDDANGTQWEHDLLSNQFRHGGDVLGLMESFDYLQGMGIKVCFSLRTLDLELWFPPNNALNDIDDLFCWDSVHQCSMGSRRIFTTGPDLAGSPPWHSRGLANDDFRSTPAWDLYHDRKHHGHVS